MLVRLSSLLRTLRLMPQRGKSRQVSLVAPISNGTRKKSLEDAVKGNSRVAASCLPELSQRSSSVVASKPKTQSIRTHVKSLEVDNFGPSRQKGKKHAVSKSYSDTLVVKLSGLTLLSNSQQTTNKGIGKRYLSTFSISSLNEVAGLIRNEKCKNIIVMAGAGISTPSGIPDFRTPGTGLYDNLDEYNLPDPSAVFDINFFRRNPRPFFRLAKELYPGNYAPNSVHYFVRMLHEKRILLKMYTQNIDALERAAGIPETKLVEAHGSFATATCRRCKASYKGGEILDDVMNQDVPKCRRKSCTGIIKPDIVFFGEDLPNQFFDYPKHFAKCDLLIVLGTSLEVQPFAGLVDEVGRSTPRLLINRDVVGPFVRSKKRSNDVVVKGDIVEGVDKLVNLLQWKKEIEMLMRKDDQIEAVPGKTEPEVNKSQGSESSENISSISDMNREELGLFKLGVRSEHVENDKQ